MSTPSAIEDVFHVALTRATPEEREAYLDRACQGDPDLRRQVERLLRGHVQADDLLEQPALAFRALLGSAHGPPGRATAGQEAVGDAIGPYTLLRKLGEGGMGTVWEAEQSEPIQRRVALKVVKPGMDSAQVLRRFEAEWQALARMDHPHVAKVLDAGATAEGRPYFVMEVVHGVPITRYCDDLAMSVRGRLELFIPVCEAVQHAHQKGIIHRDLKPSNVLVCMQDGRPIAKVIDFGVAKALHQRPLGQASNTEVGVLVGTLEYMSPEQAGMSPLGVDTRADVYALGVLLYELLTGTTPLHRTRSEPASLLEKLRRIKEEEPPRPSARLLESKELSAAAAARRNAEPARLGRELRGELDWIAMKCLEKDRTRRYESASALARDVGRYLSDEPVEACPPSPAYRVGKFARKHWAALSAAGLFLSLLVATAALSAWQALRTAAAEREARANESRALDAEADTMAFARFLANHVLAATRPEGVQQGVGIDVTMAEALARAEPALDRVFQGRPKAEALARHEIGVTWRNLGRHAEAERHLQRAWRLRRDVLGASHPLTLNSMNSLAVACLAAGKPGQALPLFEEVLARETRELGEDHPDTLTTTNNLAAAYRESGKLELALPLFERALTNRRTTLGEEHPETLTSMNNLGAAYRDAGNPKLALPLLEQAVAKLRRTRGEDHPDTLVSTSNLGLAYLDAAKPGAALPLFERVLAKQTRKLGEDHPDTLKSLSNLALAYLSVRRADEAVSLLRQWLVRERSSIADVSLGQVVANVGRELSRAGHPGKAESLLRECLARLEKARPEGWVLSDGRSLLGEALLSQEKYEDAESLLLGGYEGLRKRQDEIPPAARQQRLSESLSRLVRLYEATGDKDEAARWRKELEAHEKRALKP